MPPSIDASGRTYDQLVPFFRVVFGGRAHHGLWTRTDASLDEALESMERLLLERNAVSRGDRVLDIGCGSGRFAIRVDRQFEADVTGLDASHSQIEEARSQKDHAVKFRCEQWLQNGVANETFKHVFMIESLEHMADGEGALREVCRVLVPGGRLLMASWQVRCGMENDRAVEGIRRAGRLPGLQSGDEVRTALQAAGLQVETVESIGDQVGRTWTACLGETLRKLPRSPVLMRSVARSPILHLRMAAAALRIASAYRRGILGYQVISARKPDSTACPNI